MRKAFSDAGAFLRFGSGFCFFLVFFLFSFFFMLSSDPWISRSLDPIWRLARKSKVESKAVFVSYQNYGNVERGGQLEQYGGLASVNE